MSTISGMSGTSSAMPRPQAPPPPPQQNKFRRDPRLAAVYDRDISPVWTQPFGKLLLGQVATLPGKTTILDVMCHTGDPGLELLRRFPDSRLVAIDPSAAMIDVARQKAGPLLSRRVFLRTEAGEPKLPFDEAAFDLVVSNLGLHESAQPHLLLRELARVAKPGAQIITTVPLRGTFAEFYSLLETELQGRELEQQRLSSHLQSWPDVDVVRGWAKAAGLAEVELLISPFSLLFAGAVDLYYAPLIEFGPLLAWKSLFDRDPAEMQTVFISLRDRIEQLCTQHETPPLGLRPPLRKPLALTVRAACLRARRPL